MDNCHGCGRPYDDSFADWTICRACKQKEMEEAVGEQVYMDSLGICWTREDVEGAGGISEIERMCSESNVR